ncbi:MAG TPA: DUF4157 domain-containing protein [Kofleriaceae bacterium]|nr:DUF4157 domain-containing protein [Kofleriaceae bacterium]
MQLRAAPNATTPSGEGEVSSARVHGAADRGRAGTSGTLPHLDTIQQAFGRHDVRGVSAHVGGPAVQACDDMGAHAYASGTSVAFARAPDLHTAAHEAAHVVQQRGGVRLKDGIGASGDEYEQHADAVADLVVAGRSAESLLDAYASATAGPAQPVAERTHAVGSPVQREDKPQPPRAQPNSRVDRLIHLLTTTPPARGAEDWDEAYAFLNSFSIPDLLATISGAADRGYLPALLARAFSANLYSGAARMLSVLYVVEVARTAPSSVTNDQLNRAGVILDLIPHDQQLQIFEYILNQRGLSVAATTLVEGVIAMRERQTAAAGGPGSSAPGSGAPGGSAGGVPSTGGVPTPAGGPAAATATGPGPVDPGPWAPPGDQPIPFYIGNEAHKAIARNYEAVHRGDKVRTNSSPLSIIFRELAALGPTANPGALNDSELALMPDITNLTRLHLYEIKPLAAQSLGAAKSKMYLGLFARAGVAMALGPTSEPGTSGGVPAPGGVYMFWSPEPGVIVYQYRRGRLVPVPVPEPEPVVVRRWQFELQPLTPQQRAAVTTTTFGGAMLLVMMLLLSPVGI